MADTRDCPAFNRIYFLVNVERCGYCRKFQPVLETNLKAMGSCARAACTVADSGTPEGAAIFSELKYRGGIPCVAAVDPSGKVLEMVPGYKDSAALGPMLARMMMPA